MELGSDRAIEVNGITVDFAAGRVRDRSGRDIPLRAQSFAVLRHLAANAGRVVSKDELTAAVWRGIAVTDDSLVQCVMDIRRALGDQSQSVLRNVPKRGYELVLPCHPVRSRLPVTLALAVLALLAGLGALWWALAPEPAPVRQPAIAVLPFDDMSADRSLGYLGRGVADDIIAMLARSPDVLVIARNSSFVYGGEPVDVRRVGAELGVDYVLEGSVRREGGVLRMVAQLSDAATGEHVWAERFDQAGDDPPALLDAVTGRIVATLIGHEGQVTRAEFRRAWGKDTARLGEYDYHLRAFDVMLRDWTEAGNARVDAIAREGLAKYPDSGLIKSKLAWNTWVRAYMFWSDDLSADFEAASALVREVLAMDGLPPQTELHARWLSAYVHMREGDFDRAVAAANATAALAPYDAFIITDLVEVLVPAGRYEQALEHLAIGDARSPADAGYRHALRGWIYRLTGDHEAAVREYRAAGELWPNQRLQFAVALVRLGLLGDARAEVRAVLAEAPDFTQARWREGTFYRDQAILEGEIADLALAGLPER